MTALVYVHRTRRSVHLVQPHATWRHVRGIGFLVCLWLTAAIQPSAAAQSAEHTLFLPNLYQQYWHMAAPTSPHPADQATQQSLNVFLRWNSDTLLRQPPDSATAIRYAVYLAEDDAPSAEPIAMTTLNALDTETLLPDTLYSWRVVAIDPDGHRLEGPIWQFRTEPVPDTPDLSAVVTVPGGEFLMGCDPDNQFDTYGERCVEGTGLASSPLHAVYLHSFAIDKYEVTNQEYGACVAAGVCDPPRHARSATRADYFGNEEYDAYPVVYVSWQNAQNFCAWEGKRLPTEAEWEKAARGPIDTRYWPWGNEEFTCSRMLYSRDLACGYAYDTVRVGLFPTGMSPYGALDMAGNVAEWVSDKFDQTYYSRSPYVDPPGSDVSRVFSTIDRQSDEWGWPTYVLRGGDFLGRFYYHFLYYRYWGHWGEQPHVDDIPNFRNIRTGFRCAQTLDD